VRDRDRPAWWGSATDPASLSMGLVAVARHLDARRQCHRAALDRHKRS
jgi:hypothetical protein